MRQAEHRCRPRTPFQESLLELAATRMCEHFHLPHDILRPASEGDLAGIYLYIYPPWTHRNIDTRHPGSIDIHPSEDYLAAIHVADIHLHTYLGAVDISEFTRYMSMAPYEKSRTAGDILSVCTLYVGIIFVMSKPLCQLLCMWCLCDPPAPCQEGYPSLSP